MKDAWLEFDREHIWHPYSPSVAPLPPLPVARALGVHITLTDGRDLLDGMSSWWSAIHGYNHPELNHALKQQLERMAHVMFGGLTHQPAVELAQTLLQLAPKNLAHVFFADSGSVAVEVAMKMAIQCWAGRGYPEKHRFLTVRHGYHGDTFGAMSVCDPINGMHHLFQKVLVPQLFAMAPPLVNDADQSTALEDFARLLHQHHASIAAVIIEPLVQGAGGMRIYSADYLAAVAKLCKTYEVLLILDEIATGFGRTGTLFAVEQAQVEPDIMCVGKALTGGYLSLAATLASHAVAESIDRSESGALMHGPTYMANPLACAVANASIDVLCKSPWQQQIRDMELQLERELAPCKCLPIVADVRVKGAIGVVELAGEQLPEGLQQALVAEGIWLRPFRNLVYMMPPYLILPEELSVITGAVCRVLQQYSEKF